MSAPRLADLVHARFRVVVGDRELDLASLESEARALAATVPRGRVVEVPAGDARAALIGLEAAWMAGALPLPSARATALTPLEGVEVPDGAALALRTSGSTGVPRVAWFEAGAVQRSAARIAGYLGLVPEDTVALLQPNDHGFGLVGQLLAAAAVGARVAFCGRPFPGERAAAVAAAGATVIAAVPYGLAQLAEHLPATSPEAVARIRQVGSAGGPLAPDLARRLTTAFHAAAVWNQYGCTEAGPRLTAVPSTHPAFFTGTVGRPIEGVSIWIEGATAPGQIGEILFSSDMAMGGYLDAPDATASARRGPGFSTGDVGILDEAGRLHVVGRVDDLVKVRGERVSLERLARGAEEAGADCAVALVLDAGQADPQVVVVYEGAQAIRPTALLTHLPPGIAPRRLLWVPALPRLANGKVDRTTIEALVRGEAP
ncbi:MAG: acyl--CoA ligase [Deltaproteobacteria bacterium]|nr:acyl--CoA ligase [Deltaproteobacteria bacterium]